MESFFWISLAAIRLKLLPSMKCFRSPKLNAGIPTDKQNKMKSHMYQLLAKFYDSFLVITDDLYLGKLLQKILPFCLKDRKVRSFFFP